MNHISSSLFQVKTTPGVFPRNITPHHRCPFRANRWPCKMITRAIYFSIKATKKDPCAPHAFVPRRSSFHWIQGATKRPVGPVTGKVSPARSPAGTVTFMKLRELLLRGTLAVVRTVLGSHFGAFGAPILEPIRVDLDPWPLDCQRVTIETR